LGMKTAPGSGNASDFPGPAKITPATRRAGKSAARAS
jgi:hypothetical protein